MPCSTQYAAVSRSLSRTSGFTLRTNPGAAGSTGMLAAEVAGVPAQHVAEEHRGLVVEVVAGRDDVVAVLERGRVEQVTLRQAARAARRAAGGGGRAGDVEAVVVGEVDLVQADARARREARGCTRPTRRSSRRCRGRGRGRRPRSRGARGCPRARASPCRPRPRPAPARPARSSCASGSPGAPAPRSGARSGPGRTRRCAGGRR